LDRRTTCDHSDRIYGDFRKQGMLECEMFCKHIPEAWAIDYWTNSGWCSCYPDCDETRTIPEERLKFDNGTEAAVKTFKKKEAPTPAPTLPPTHAPTLPPTHAPTPAPTAIYCKCSEAEGFGADFFCYFSGNSDNHVSVEDIEKTQNMEKPGKCESVCSHSGTVEYQQRDVLCETCNYGYNVCDMPGADQEKRQDRVHSAAIVDNDRPSHCCKISEEICNEHPDYGYHAATEECLVVNEEICNGKSDHKWNASASECQKTCALHSCPTDYKSNPHTKQSTTVTDDNCCVPTMCRAYTCPYPYYRSHTYNNSGNLDTCCAKPFYTREAYQPCFIKYGDYIKWDGSTYHSKRENINHRNQCQSALKYLNVTEVEEDESLERTSQPGATSHCWIWKHLVLNSEHPSFGTGYYGKKRKQLIQGEGWLTPLPVCYEVATCQASMCTSHGGSWTNEPLHVKCSRARCGLCDGCEGKAACPDNSIGTDTAYGCTCQDGYSGTITASESAPYYTGSCKALTWHPYLDGNHTCDRVDERLFGAYNNESAHDISSTTKCQEHCRTNYPDAKAMDYWPKTEWCSCYPDCDESREVSEDTRPGEGGNVDTYVWK
jgi:hypothetical protein